MLSEKLSLRPAVLQDKIKIYNWLANSNLTSEMLGPPKFPNSPIPTYEEFDEDYVSHYFDNSAPLEGRCFIITFEQEEIGVISYIEIDQELNSTEIDIWLADAKFTGKGYGTEAINMLCYYLGKNYNCKQICIAPSRRNVNAIKSYKKAGFVETKNIPDSFIPDYEDSVFMVKINCFD